MSLCQRAEGSRRLRRPGRGLLATLAVAALAGTMLATSAGAATHAVPSGRAVRASAPTATISVEVQSQGTVLNNYYVAQAAAFNKANPGDHVTMDVVPTNNVYKQKLLLQLQGNNPPALFQTWGGGIRAVHNSQGGPTLCGRRREQCWSPHLGIRFPGIDSRQLHLRRSPQPHALHGHAAGLLLL